MSTVWCCGDCGTFYPKTIAYCQRPYDDYLSLHGGLVDVAIQRAVRARIDPLIAAAERRLRGGRTMLGRVEQFAIAA